MSNNSKILIAVVVVVAVFGGLWLFLGSNEELMNTSSQNQQQVSNSNAASSSADNQESRELIESGESTGAYVDYSAEKLANSEGNRVLFFHADWCPTCRSLDQNIRAGVVPNDLTIFKVDYDTVRDLAKKYGVTYQHTLVQVDASGEQLNKWAGSYTIQQIVDELI